MLKQTLFLFMMVLLGVGLFSCEEDEEMMEPEEMTMISYDLMNLDPLENGYHYEGWAIIDGSPVSTGKFNVNDAGDLVDMDGNSINNGQFDAGMDLSDASAVVVSIEPDNDSDPAPAATKYLGGGVSNSMATLSVSHSSALGTDFMNAMGEYILATPTNGSMTNENSGIWFLNPPSTTFTMDVSALDSLQNGYHYEGWALVDGSPVTTGKFNVNSMGQAVDLEGNMIPNGEFTVGGDLGSATAVIISIEPDGDTDPAPSNTKYLAGDVAQDMATLDVSHSAALGDDFTSAMGDYILATPTNGSDSDENSGIWFLDPTGASPVAGLDIPTLPAGWKYEGWVVIDGTPVTTGKFTDPAAADEAAPYSGTMDGPPFPGEDFLNNAPAGLTFPTDLSGQTAVISIEPEMDDTEAPFTLKPLAGMIPDPATDHTLYSMNNQADGFPTISVSISVEGAMAGLDLPTLPDGWKYEGWVVMDGTPVTSGKFTDVAMADESAPYSGSMSGPPFPGEDYLMNAPMGLTFPTDLAGQTAVISVEPEPDDTEAPFTLKPLTGMIPMDATDHMVYDMDTNTGSLPTGTATIQ
ncbi:MAG: hypothetical protein GF372_09245 [Candidatus Marinimicrobia bacterium]|nr:hypothetical protein [Candidatus Neomarinimicrobiota bacterium]